MCKPCEHSLVGETVHYVLPQGARAGECRPAIVLREIGHTHRYVNLMILSDGQADGLAWREYFVPTSGVPYSAEGGRHTWHYKPTAQVACSAHEEVLLET